MVNSIKLIKNLIKNKHVPSSLLNTEEHRKEAQTHKKAFSKYVRYSPEIIID